MPSPSWLPVSQYSMVASDSALEMGLDGDVNDDEIALMLPLVSKHNLNSKCNNELVDQGLGRLTFLQ